MNGKHLSVASSKTAAIWHKLLCIVVAISLIALMIPNGLRAHAESEASQTQDEQIVQEEAQEQQVVPADEPAEGGQSEEAVPKAEVVLTLSTLPNNAAGYWTKDYNAVVDNIAVPLGAAICPQGKSSTSDIFVYTDASTSDIFCTLNWVSDLPNNENFETWVFDNEAIDASNSPVTICNSDSVFAAGLTGWNAVENASELTIYADGSRGYLEYSEDGSEWTIASNPLVYESLEDGYYYYTVRNEMIIHKPDDSVLVYVRAVAETGQKFSHWLISAPLDPHYISGQDMNIALFDPLETCYVNLSTWGTGTAEFYNYDSEMQPISGPVTSILLPKGYALRNSEEGFKSLVDYGFLDESGEFIVKGHIYCDAHDGLQVNGWSILGEYQLLQTDSFYLYAYIGPVTTTIYLYSGGTGSGGFYRFFGLFGENPISEIDIPTDYKYEITTNALGYNCINFYNAAGDWWTFETCSAIPETDNFCTGIVSSDETLEGVVHEGLYFTAGFWPIEKVHVDFDTSSASMTGSGFICNIQGEAVDGADVIPGSTYEIYWNELFGCYYLNFYNPGSSLPASIFYTKPYDEENQCVWFTDINGQTSGLVEDGMCLYAAFEVITWKDIVLTTDGGGSGCFRNSLTSEVVENVHVPNDYTYTVSNEADVYTINFYDIHGTLTSDSVYTESNYYSVCVGVEPNAGGPVSEVTKFTATFDEVESYNVGFSTSGTSGKIYKSDGTLAADVQILKGSDYKIYWSTIDGRYYLDFYTNSSIVPDYSYYAWPDNGSTCISFLPQGSDVIEGTVEGPMTFVATFEKTVYYGVTLVTEGGDSSCCWRNYWSGVPIKGTINIEKNWEYKIVKNNKTYRINFYDSHGTWTGDIYYADSNANWECTGITPDQMEGVIDKPITFTAHYVNVSRCKVSFVVEGEGGVYDIWDPWADDPIYSLNVPKGTTYDLYLYEPIGSPKYYRLDFYTSPFSVFPDYSFFAQPAPGYEFVSFLPLGSGTIDGDKEFYANFRAIPETRTLYFINNDLGYVTDISYQRLNRVEVPNGAHWGTEKNEITGEVDLYVETDQGRDYYFGVGYASACRDWWTDPEFRSITTDCVAMPIFDVVALDTVNLNSNGNGAFYDYYGNKVQFTKLPLGCTYSSYLNTEDGIYYIDFYRDGELWSEFYAYPDPGNWCSGVTPLGEGAVTDDIVFMAKFEESTMQTISLDTYGNGQIYDFFTDEPITENSIEVPLGAVYTYSYNYLSFYDVWGYCYGAYYAVANENSDFRGWRPNKSWVIEKDMNFQAQFGVNISGTVVDEGGNIIQGATVRYFPQLNSTDFQILDISNENGAYKQIVPSGLEGTLIVSKDGYQTLQYTLTSEYTLQGHDDLQLVLIAAASYTLSFNVQGGGTGKFWSEEESDYVSSIQVPDGACIVTAADHQETNPTAYIYNNEYKSTLLDTITFIPNERCKFNSWSTSSDVVHSNYVLTANCSVAISTLSFDVEGSGTGKFWSDEEGDYVLSIEVPNGSYFEVEYDLFKTYPVVYIYSDSTEQNLLDTITFIPNEGCQFDDWSEYSAVISDDYLLTAYCSVYNTLSFDVEGSGTGKFLSETIGDYISSIAVPDGAFFVVKADLYTIYPVVYIYSDITEQNLLDTITFIPGERNAFTDWSSWTGLIFDDYTLTAYCKAVYTLSFDVEGSGSGTLWSTAKEAPVASMDVLEGTLIMVETGQQTLYPEASIYSDYTRSEWIDTISFIPDEGCEFDRWSASYEIISTDFVLTAYCTKYHTLSFDVQGTGTGTLWSDEQEGPAMPMEVPEGALIMAETGQVTYYPEIKIYRDMTAEVCLDTITFIADYGSEFVKWSTTYKEIDDDYTLIANCKEQTTSLSGKVTHNDYLPVEDAGVFFIPGFQSNEDYFFTTTDKDGKYRFDLLERGVGGRLVIEDGDGICQVAYRDLSDWTMDADSVIEDFDLKKCAELTINPFDDESHNEFDWVYTIDGEWVDEGSEPEYIDYFDDHTFFSFDEDGIITFGFENPLGTYEEVVVTPVAAEGYTFDSYVDANTGEALEVGEAYEIMLDSGDVNLIVNYSSGVVPPQPQPQPGGETAQTGDVATSVFIGLAILALISCACVVRRRVKVTK